MNNTQREYFDNIAEIYDRIRISTKMSESHISKIIDHMEFYIKGKDSKLLEVGAGTGIYSANILNRGYNIIGLDFSPKMAKKAKERGIEMIIGDAERLPFRHNVFDACIAVDVIHHVMNPVSTFKECNRVLNESGKLLIAEPNFKNPWNLLYQKIKKNEKIFRLKFIKQLCNNSNFNLDDCAYINYFPVIVPDCFFNCLKIFERRIPKQFNMFSTTLFVCASKTTVSKKGTLLVINDFMGSFSAFSGTGLASREFSLFNEYGNNFRKVQIMTPDNEKFEGFSGNIEHIPFINMPFNKTIYFLLAGIINFKDADYVELSSPWLIFPCIIYKLLRRRIFVYYRWSITEVIKSRNFFKLYEFFLITIFTLTELISFKLSDSIGVTTEPLANHVRKFTKKEKIHLLPNFIDTDLFAPNNQKKVPNLLIYVGRLSPEKNIQMLLDAMKLLPEFKLNIIGEYGTEKNDLIKYTENQAISNVFFKGRIPNEDLPKYLNEGEAFIIVSHTEGQPKVILEAMSCGLPCIGTNVNGIRDVIIDGKNGYLCNKDAESIKESVMKLFSNKEKMRLMSECSRNYVKKNYSIKDIIILRINLIRGDIL